ncbi:MAG: hypothetical protein OEV93_04075 [Candidatus Moranbacteria bacterium]|nr:hypothetical protein [Candidatus Moranbacteria bacterium]
MIGKINFSDYKAFTYFSLFWVLLGWVAFILTLIGFFHIWILESFLAIGFLFFAYQIFFKKYHQKTSQNIQLISVFILLITISFSLFSTPTIFSGRDQGSIAEAAIRLSENHQLRFSTPVSQEFFKINHENLNSVITNKDSAVKRFFQETDTIGKALNFPGFHYTRSGELITQFPIPYIAWLATFYSIFGLSGFAVANGILFFLFFMSLYLIACTFSPSPKNLYPALLCTIFVIASFMFSWFLKFTLSENMALALIWIGVFQIVIALKSQKESSRKLFIASSILTMGLMIFTRIEGLAFFFMMLVALFVKKETRTTILEHKSKLLILPIISIFVIFIINFFIDIAFYKEMAKAFIKAESSGISPKIAILQILSTYGILIYLILAIFETFHLLRNKQYFKLAPLFVTLPAFIYILNPQISSDHPWMLRRFLFAIFPALILYSSLLITRISHRKHFWAHSLIILIIAFNIPLTINFFTFSENINLLNQTEKISQNFSENDLILIDQDVSGDGWSMISDPMNFMFQKNSIYFFNPSDFDRINKDSFENIYLISPEEKISYYQESSLGEKMKFHRNYSISTTRLQKSDLHSIPKKEIITVSGKIFKLN